MGFFTEQVAEVGKRCLCDKVKGHTAKNEDQYPARQQAGVWQYIWCLYTESKKGPADRKVQQENRVSDFAQGVIPISTMKTTEQSKQWDADHYSCARFNIKRQDRSHSGGDAYAEGDGYCPN